MESVTSQPGQLIRVLVVDASRIHTQLLAEALQRDRRFEVIATHGSAGTLEAAKSHRIDIAAISTYLDDKPLRGLDVLRELRAAHPEIRGVMLLDSVGKEIVLEAFRAGARGIFNRCESIEALCKCVLCVHEGQIWASAEEMSYAVEALAASPTVRATDANGFNLLSARELEVVRCLAKGMTNREIADEMRLSRHTIKNYVFRIFEKLGVSNRVELLFMTLSRAGSPATPLGGKFQLQENNQEGPDPVRPDTAQNSAIAYIQLARKFRDGHGTSPDLVSSYMWYLISEETNLRIRDQIAIEKSSLANLLDSSQILAAQKRASEYLKNISKSPVRIGNALTQVVACVICLALIHLVGLR